MSTVSSTFSPTCCLNHAFGVSNPGKEIELSYGKLARTGLVNDLTTESPPEPKKASMHCTEAGYPFSAHYNYAFANISTDSCGHAVGEAGRH